MRTTTRTVYILLNYTYREPNRVVLCPESHPIEPGTLPFEGDYLNAKIA